MCMRAGSYLSAVDALSSDARLAVTATDDIQGLGFVDSAANADGLNARSDADLVSGSRMELPLWMCDALDRAKCPIRIEMPEILQSSGLSILASDPSALHLPRLGPAHFYSTFLGLMQIKQLADESVVVAVMNAFGQRFRYLMDQAQHVSASDVLSVSDRLDAFERQLLRSGVNCSQEMKQWFERRTHAIRASEMVRQQRKRKAQLMN